MADGEIKIDMAKCKKIREALISALEDLDDNDDLRKAIKLAKREIGDDPREYFYNNVDVAIFNYLETVRVMLWSRYGFMEACGDGYPSEDDF